MFHRREQAAVDDLREECQGDGGVQGVRPPQRRSGCQLRLRGHGGRAQRRDHLQRHSRPSPTAAASAGQQPAAEDCLLEVRHNALVNVAIACGCEVAHERAL